MLRKLLFGLLITVSFLSCSKSEDDNDSGAAVNTWQFTSEGTVHKGELLWDSQLNMIYQGNDSYTYTMLGVEETTGYFFNIVLSLLDTTFTVNNYQSGISGNDYINAFYFTTSLGGTDIYKSSNYDPGPVINFNVQSYNASTSTLVLTFSGNVKKADGTTVALTNGKVTCKVEKL